MNTLPTKTLLPALLLTTLVGTSGCVSFDLGVKDLVGDAIAAGKSFYRTIRYRRDGTEERLYSHVSAIPAGQSDVEAGAGCLGYLAGLADAASGGDAEILAESTEIVGGEDEDGTPRSMRCTLTVVVPRDA